MVKDRLTANVFRRIAFCSSSAAFFSSRNTRAMLSLVLTCQRFFGRIFISKKIDSLYNDSSEETCSLVFCFVQERTEREREKRMTNVQFNCGVSDDDGVESLFSGVCVVGSISVEDGSVVKFDWDLRRFQ